MPSDNSCLCPPFTFSSLLTHTGDKLSDKKTKDLVGSLLSALSSSVRPVFVVKRMQYVMDKTKAPLAHQHYLEWLKVRDTVDIIAW